jgi:molecular chaperone DnaK
MPYTVLNVKVESQIAELKKVLAGDDKAQITQASEALQQAMMKLGQAAYQEPHPETAPNGRNGSHQAQPTNEDVVEGEFSEA